MPDGHEATHERMQRPAAPNAMQTPDEGHSALWLQPIAQKRPGYDVSTHSGVVEAHPPSL